MTGDAATSVHIEREDGREAARADAPDTVQVGRSIQSDLVVANDPHVSAEHFRLEYRDSEWWIHDLESRNGTYVNGAQVRQAIVRDGDQIRAGETGFRIRLETREPPADQEAETSEEPAEAETAALGIARIVNTTPFTVGTAYSEDGDGRAWLSIVVKATWTIDPSPTPASTQLPIFTSDQFTSDDPASPVRFESDLVPFKPGADVVLVGRAHAPSHEPVTQLVAGLRVGSLSRAVAVFGDRAWQWQASGTPAISKPRPFTTMELAYERAFGGIDGPGAMYCKENLVGTGFIGKKTRDRIDGLSLPNLEDPRNLIVSCDTHPSPVGLGFYGRGWMPRLAYAGTYDDRYMEERHPLPPVDFSHRFFNGAHPDLQVEGYLRGDEDVVLLNVCPDAPEMRFQLPGVVPQITVFRWAEVPDQSGGEHHGPDGSLRAEWPMNHELITAVLDTLVFIPEQGIFYEVFRGVCRLSTIDSLETARIDVTL